MCRYFSSMLSKIHNAINQINTRKYNSFYIAGNIYNFGFSIKFLVKFWKNPNFSKFWFFNFFAFRPLSKNHVPLCGTSEWKKLDGAKLNGAETFWKKVQKWKTKKTNETKRNERRVKRPTRGGFAPLAQVPPLFRFGSFRSYITTNKNH